MISKGIRRLPDGRAVSVHYNQGLRKICGCPRRGWAKCKHGWHVAFSWKGKAYRFSLDRHAGKHIEGKTAAQELADRIRADIRDGRFGTTPAACEGPTGPSTTSAPMSFETFSQIYLERFSEAREKTSAPDDAAMLRRVMAFPISWPGATRLGQKPLLAVSQDDFETVVRHIASVRSTSTRNHYVQLLRSMSSWAVRKGYRELPIVTSDSDVVRRKKDHRRSRRLEPGEEEKLLASANPHLQRLIIAALETCCRQGELLKLQWRDVSLARGEIHLRAQNTKTSTSRIVPISDRLRAVLEMVRTDPSGQEFGPLAYVFGDELGSRVKTIHAAWETAALKAHGHQPVWAWTVHKREGKQTQGGTLSGQSHAQYRAIDLHFHDLRHEAGSRLLEAGWPLHEVQQMLGHASLQQTSTYLNATLRGLHRSMRALDQARNAPPPADNSTDNPQTVSASPCKDVASESPSAHRPPCKADGPPVDKSLIH